MVKTSKANLFGVGHFIYFLFAFLETAVEICSKTEFLENYYVVYINLKK